MLDTLSVIQAQLAVIIKRLGTTTVSFIQTNLSCDFYGGGIKAIIVNLIVLLSSKLNKQIISITIKGRTIPTPTHIIDRDRTCTEIRV